MGLFDALDDLQGLADLVNQARTAPARARAGVADMAAKFGLDVLPKIHAVIRRTEAKRWELVAVSLEPETLPPCGPDERRVAAQLDFEAPSSPAPQENPGEIGG